jgi:hypothetical protein
MKSPRGLLAALLLLLAFPLAVLVQVLFGAGSETVVHLVGAFGFAFLALSFFDFTPPRWIAWAGCVAASALAVVFAVQGVSTLLPDESLHRVAFDVLGDRPERAAIVVLLFALLAVCLIESRGVTRIVGLVTILGVVALELYRVGVGILGIPEGANLRILYLLPFVWLLLESRKERSPGVLRVGDAVVRIDSDSGA